MHGRKLLLSCLFASVAIAGPVNSAPQQATTPVNPATVPNVPIKGTDNTASGVTTPDNSAKSAVNKDITSPDDKTLPRPLVLKNVDINDDAEISNAVSRAKGSSSNPDDIDSYVKQYAGDIQNFLKTFEQNIREQLENKYAAKQVEFEAQIKAKYENAIKDAASNCAFKTRDGNSETITETEIDGKKKKKGRKIIVNVTNNNSQNGQGNNGNSGGSSGGAVVSTSSPYDSLISTGVSGLAYGAGAGAAYALLRNKDTPTKPVKEISVPKQPSALQKSDEAALNDLLYSDPSKDLDLKKIDANILKPSSSVSESEIAETAKELGLTVEEVKASFAAEKQLQDLAAKVNRLMQQELKATAGLSTLDAYELALNKEAKEMEVPVATLRTKMKGFLANIFNAGDFSKIDIVNAVDGIVNGSPEQIAKAFQHVWEKEAPKAENRAAEDALKKIEKVVVR